MSEVATTMETPAPNDLLATGRRHLAVKDFSAAVETLATACELLAKEHGEAADQCAEAYLWYGKSLLGLSREESGVLGDGVPGAEHNEDDENDEENGDEQNDGEGKNGEAENEEVDEPVEHGEAEAQTNGDADKEPAKSEEKEKPELDNEEPTSTNAEVGENEQNEENAGNAAEAEPNNESTLNMEDEDDDVDNLQLAWEMLDLARSILYRRVQDGGGQAARALLADVHLALGEVALESETYDKAVDDMQTCLDLQKELYGNDDRRIAETHYQIGLANSLASNFDDAITHFKNAANILETRILTLESYVKDGNEDAAKKPIVTPGYTIEAEIKELRELLPEVHEKINDMVEYKEETVKRVREALLGDSGNNGASAASTGFSSSSAPSGAGSASAFSGAGSASAFSGSGSGASSSKPASNISHLIKRKRKNSEDDKGAEPAAKKITT